MKKAVKILRDVQSYENGKVYRLHESFADSLIKRGKAEEVKTEQKEEKKVIETKEEKHSPAETKEPKETLSIKKLADVIEGYGNDELNDIIDNDERVTAVRMAQAELDKR